jgi:hypothetical protein
VYREGYIKLTIPSSFNISSGSSAVALFKITDEDDINYASVHSYDNITHSWIIG